MYVDIYTMRFNVNTEINEWVTAFGKESGVRLLDSFLYCRGLNCTVVDEQNESSLLHVVIGIADPSFRFEAPSVTGGLKLNNFICNRTSMDLSNPFNGGCLS